MHNCTEWIQLSLPWLSEQQHWSRMGWRVKVAFFGLVCKQCFPNPVWPANFKFGFSQSVAFTFTVFFELFLLSPPQYYLKYLCLCFLTILVIWIFFIASGLSHCCLCKQRETTPMSVFTTVTTRAYCVCYWSHLLCVFFLFL
jgi:hypothetical protein